MSDPEPIPPESHFNISSTFMFRWEDSQDAYVLMYPEGIVKLNQTAGEILRYCDGQHSVRDITAALCTKFDMNEAFVTERVNQFLEVCRGKGWIRAES